jgi:hypothetical protein
LGQRLLVPISEVVYSPTAEVAHHGVASVIMVQALEDEAPHQEQRGKQALVESFPRGLYQPLDDRDRQQSLEYREQLRKAWFHLRLSLGRHLILLSLESKVQGSIHHLSRKCHWFYRLLKPEKLVPLG